MRGHQVTVYERNGAPPEGSADEAFLDGQRIGAAHAFRDALAVERSYT